MSSRLDIVLLRKATIRALRDQLQRGNEEIKRIAQTGLGWLETFFSSFYARILDHGCMREQPSEIDGHSKTRDIFGTKINDFLTNFSSAKVFL